MDFQEGAVRGDDEGGEGEDEGEEDEARVDEGACWGEAASKPSLRLGMVFLTKALTCQRRLHEQQRGCHVLRRRRLVDAPFYQKHKGHDQASGGSEKSIYNKEHEQDFVDHVDAFKE